MHICRQLSKNDDDRYELKIQRASEAQFDRNFVSCSILALPRRNLLVSSVLHPFAMPIPAASKLNLNPHGVPVPKALDAIRPPPRNSTGVPR
jgi:hypothetical protein